MLRLPDAWTWDFWVADTGREYHAFFLRASRALSNPEDRHLRASVGHAVSNDLHKWKLLPDALVRAERPAFDDMATWTGSVVRGPNGLWHKFYTGISSVENGQVQRIGMVTSRDLIQWERPLDFKVLSADERWYEKLGEASWIGETWRDPWVFPDPSGKGWHMFVTARGRDGEDDNRGVVGHLCSDDLVTWNVLPPLSIPDSGFGVLEVLQVQVVDGRPVLLFSCSTRELSSSKRMIGARGGIWTVGADSLLGPFDISRATLLSDDRLFCGRLVTNHHGKTVLLAFHNQNENGVFVGGLSDPMPVKWNKEGQLVLAERHRPPMYISSTWRARPSFRSRVSVGN